MTKGNSIKSSFCMLLVTCLIFSAAIAAFAYPEASSTNDPEAIFTAGPDKQRQYLEEAVLKLVQEGKLSKEKADSIIEFKKKRAEEWKSLTNQQREKQRKEGKRLSVLGELVKNRIITEQEARAIKDKLREMKDVRVSDGIQGLIDNGVLTAEDIDNMRSYMLKIREERKADIEKIKSMTPEQRKLFFKENKAMNKDILTRMVEDRILTEKQAEEIKKAVPELGRSRFRTPKE